MQIQQTIIKFPEIKLSTRHAHKLRGYFGNLFKEKSPLLHNHFESGEQRYAYPLVQYKVINGTPHLIGVNEGAELLISLFLKIERIEVEGRAYPVLAKNITNKNLEISVDSQLLDYEFVTLWMGLNQKNFNKYISLIPGEEKKNFLSKILVGNILSMYKTLGFWTEKEILAKLTFKEKSTLFKNRRMTAFEGKFTTNAIIPDMLGLGKGVSRGFGTVKQLK